MRARDVKMMMQYYYGHILHQEVVFVVKMKTRTIKMKMWVMMARTKEEELGR